MTPTSSGTTYEQGDIVLCDIPFSDSTGVKRRPVMILSVSTYNSRTADVIALAITSNLSNSDYSVPIEDRDMVQGKMFKPSLIKVNHIFSVAKSTFQRWLGRAAPAVVAKSKSVLSTLI